MANILAEPVGRGTGPAIGLAAEILARRDPDAILVVLTSDHLIQNRSLFREVLHEAAHCASEGHLVLLGITPNEPNTGLGYIEANGRLGGQNMPVLGVASFKEKPKREVAEQFLAAGNYYWNSGMFVWRLDTVRQAMREFMADTADRVARIADAWDTPDRQVALDAHWEGIASETIDYGVVERASNVAVIPADIGWSDVGSWAALFDVLDADEHGNIVEGEYIGVDARNNLVYSPHRTVAALGVQDMVIVDTKDVLLILPRDRAQDVRAVVDELKRRDRSDLL